MVGKKFISVSSEGLFCLLQPEGNLLSFYCSLIWPIVETYWVSCLYLFKLLKDNLILQTAKLQSEIQWFGQSLITQRIILYLEAISMDTIKNSLGTLSSLKMIKEVSESGKTGVKVIAEEEKLKSLEGKIS